MKTAKVGTSVPKKETVRERIQEPLGDPFERWRVQEKQEEKDGKEENCEV